MATLRTDSLDGGLLLVGNHYRFFERFTNFQVDEQNVSI